MKSNVRVLYWKEVPVQVQAEDEVGRVSVMLDDRFQEGADAIAMFDGSYGSDEYLEGWHWTKPQEVEATAREAASRSVTTPACRAISSVGLGTCITKECATPPLEL